MRKSRAHEISSLIVNTTESALDQMDIDNIVAMIQEEIKAELSSQIQNVMKGALGIKSSSWSSEKYTFDASLPRLAVIKQLTSDEVTKWMRDVGLPKTSEVTKQKAIKRHTDWLTDEMENTWSGAFRHEVERILEEYRGDLRTDAIQAARHKMTELLTRE